MTTESVLLQKHKKLFYGFLVIGPVFFGCFSFPFVNLTHEWSGNLTVLNMFVFAAAYYNIGLVEAVVFPVNAGVKIILLNLILTCVGFGCRYLLEYGEFSNTYNFTIPNVVLHLLVSTAISTLVWLWNAKKMKNKV